MKLITLTVAFILELIAFAFFAGVAFTISVNVVLQVVAAIVLFVLLITFWSMFMAPRAAKKLSPPAYYLCKMVIYAISAYSIFQLINSTYGYAFAAAALLDEAVLFRHNLSKS